MYHKIKKIGKTGSSTTADKCYAALNETAAQAIKIRCTVIPNRHNFSLYMAWTAKQTLAMEGKGHPSSVFSGRSIHLRCRTEVSGL